MPSEDKMQLIDEFHNIRSTEFEEMGNLIGRIDAYTSKNGEDSQLILIRQTLLLRKSDSDLVGFDKCCELAAPIIEELEKIISWHYLEFSVLSTAIIYTYDYKKTLDLADEAIAVLEDEEFVNERRFIGIKNAINFNIPIRLIRAIQTEVDHTDTKSIDYLTKRFNHFYNSAMKACVELSAPAHILVLEIRKAILDNSYESILDGLKELAKVSKPWHKTTQDEVAEHVYHMQGKKIPESMMRFLIGYNIKRRREEMNISSLDFAFFLDTSQQVVLAFESGRKGVSNERLSQIAKILRVEISYFYTFGNSSKQNVLKKEFVITDLDLINLALKFEHPNVPEKIKKIIHKHADEHLDYYISQSDAEEPENQEEP